MRLDVSIALRAEQDMTLQYRWYLDNADHDVPSKVALHRRGSSQREVKEKPKNCGTAFTWTILSLSIVMRSRRERAT